MVPSHLPPAIAGGESEAQGLPPEELEGDYAWVREYEYQVRFSDKGECVQGRRDGVGGWEVGANLAVSSP
jgi:hypothetical protein